MDMEKTGTYLASLRRGRDMTQQQVADAIGITQRKYSYVETGTQPLTDDLMSALAALYCVSVDYLLCRTDTPQPYPRKK